MREMDLIPPDYRRVQGAKQILSRFGVLFVIVIVCLVAGKFFLNSKVSGVKEQILFLQEKQQVFETQNKQIADLKTERATVKNQLAFVEMLQQGGGAEEIFLVFDRVMDNTVWLEDWQYMAGKLSEGEDDQSEPMKILIRGRSIDHTALSGFVDRLTSQPEVSDVKVIRSAMSSENKTVGFEMEIS